MKPILGIETSCDETAVAIVRAGVVLASRTASQVPLHLRFGGVVPEIAARNHLLTVLPTLQAALDDAGLQPQDLGGIGVTNRPGLIGALLVGVQTAKTLALIWNLPIVGVDHIEAHVWAALLRPPPLQLADWPKPELPFLALAVSGGHTSLYRVQGPGKMTLLGRTLDDAAGEAFDKFAKLIGLPYPGGPSVQLAAEGGDDQRFALPRGVLGRDDFAFSFSGLKTAVRMRVDSLRAGGVAIEGQVMADLCASLQRNVVEQLVRITLRAARQQGLRDVVVAGGVAANARLRADLAAACVAAGLRFWPVPPRWCTDNAAMVAGLAEALLAGGVRDDPHALDAQATGAHKRSLA